MREAGKKDILYQVNGVAYIEADLKLADLRILMAIIKALQGPIKYSISRSGRHGIPAAMLPEQRTISPYGKIRVLNIPVSDFHLGIRNGGRLRSYLEALITTRCVFPVLPPREGRPQPLNVYSGMIVDYEFPAYAKTVNIFLQEEMVSRLLLTENGYSQYSHASALSLTNKCTVRLYWLICSWRNRGGFAISVSNLMKILSLGKSYNRRDNLIEKIIKPAQKELEANFPIWFRFRVVESETKTRIYFKIQLKLDAASRSKEIGRVHDIWFYSLSELGIKRATIDEVFLKIEMEDLTPFSLKIQKLLAHLKENRFAIRDTDAYFRQSMQQWFDDWTLRYQDVADTDDYPVG